MKSIKDIDKKHIINTYNRYDLELVEGMGVNAYDIDNKEYIDLSAGIGVNSLGFCEMGWVASVTQQLCKLNHVSNLFYSQPDALLAKSLCERRDMTRCFCQFGSGSQRGCDQTGKKVRQREKGRVLQPNHHTTKFFPRQNHHYTGCNRAGFFSPTLFPFY